MLERPQAERITVRVPASTANLGAGFDVLGMALQRYLTLTIESAPAGSQHVRFPGDAAKGAGRGDRIARQAIAAGLALVGQERLGYQAEVTSDIPPGRGLGASAALRVAGVAAGAALGGAAPAEAVVREAARLDGHADNVAAAWAGGLTVSALGDGHLMWLPLRVPDSLCAVVAVPEATVNTRESRAALPSTIAREDAVFNLARVALFVAALREERYDLLREAMQDRLHQPYRLARLPASAAALEAALRAGAKGAALSGSGPSVLALCDRLEGRQDAVAAAMDVAFREAGMSSHCFPLSMDNLGTRLERVTVERGR